MRGPVEPQVNKRAAVITGGGRGFGKAFGAALAQQGVVVALIDRDESVVRLAAREIGALAVPFAGDVTDEARMKTIMAEMARIHGGIDILINNAGLHSQEYSRPLAEMGVEKTRRLFEVNVIGVVACTLAARPFMSGRAGASIVNIASSAAYLGGGYGTSKLAVIGLTITFARELAAEGIRVNAIAPGVILTETIRTEMAAETLARIKSMQYLSSDGEEQDIVEAMLYLTSQRARFVTAETLRVTGGFAAGA
jgi:3-oxoacyl-[acyl-carrier protein] reductase